MKSMVIQHSNVTTNWYAPRCSMCGKNPCTMTGMGHEDGLTTIKFIDVCFSCLQNNAKEKVS